MIDLIYDVSSESLVITSAAWVRTRVGSEYTITPPTGSVGMARYIVANTYYGGIYQNIYPGRSIGGMSVTFRAFLSAPTGAGTPYLQLAVSGGVGGDVTISDIPGSGEWKAFEVTRTFDASETNSFFQAIIRVGSSGAGDGIGIFFPHVLIDGSSFISLAPEYDFKRQDQKIESRARSRSGREYVYKWGEYERRSFSVRYVDSYIKSVINSYWSSNAPLVYVMSGGTEVISGMHLLNKTAPISGVEKPYTDLFKGKIDIGRF